MPGPMPRLVRLTHAQSDATIRDRFGLDLAPSTAFIEDATFAGFANNAAGLLVSDRLARDYHLPYVTAGSAGGYLRTGEYVKVTAQSDTKNDADAPHNKLLTTCMNAVGVPTTRFGSSYGEAGELDQLKK